MALDFPTSPTNGQVYGNFVYSTAKGAWQAKPITGKVTTSATAPSAPSNGDEWFNTNDGNLYVYYTDVDGSQWVQVKSDATLSSTLGNRVETLEAKPSGLVPMIPASVTLGSGSSSVSSTGLVTFTSASTISLNNVFNSTYRSYKVVLSFNAFSASATDLSYRLRSAGTDLSAGTNYAGGHTVNQSGTVTVESASAQTAMWCGKGASNYPPVTSVSTEISQPFISNTSTAFITNASAFDSSQTRGMYFSGVNATVGSYDGLTLIINTGNASGTMAVYGYR